MSIQCSFRFNALSAIKYLALTHNENKPLFFQSKSNPTHFYSQNEMLSFLADLFEQPEFFIEELKKIPHSEVDLIASLNNKIHDSLSHFNLLNFEAYIACVVEERLKKGIFVDKIDINQTMPYQIEHTPPEKFPKHFRFNGRETPIDKNTLSVCLTTRFFTKSDHYLPTKELEPLINYSLCFIFTDPAYQIKQKTKRASAKQK